MGKPTGFMEYERKLPQDREPEVRMKDWEEFHTHCSLEDLQTQGARCMNCGVPFCHTGDRLVGGCPLNTLFRNGMTLFITAKLKKHTTDFVRQVTSLNLQVESVLPFAKVLVHQV